jgi:hypothetical protein
VACGRAAPCHSLNHPDLAHSAEHLEQQDVRQSFWRDTRVPTRERCFSAALSRAFQNLFPQIFLSQQDYLIIKFLKNAAAPFNGFPQALEGVW